MILTGEALRRENAEAIAGVLAEQGGEFVCATAGHNMEAMLAAYGSGAAKASYDEAADPEHRHRRRDDEARAGRPRQRLATAAVHVGGRLQVVDDDGRITRLDLAGPEHAARAGLDWTSATPPRRADREGRRDHGRHLVAAIVADPLPDDVEQLYLTDPLGPLADVDGVMFSGGVAEYVYQREEQTFGDLGRPLGRAVRRGIDGALPLAAAARRRVHPRHRPGRVGVQRVQLSGNTPGGSPDPDALLPRRNLQVVRPVYELADDVDAETVAPPRSAAPRRPGRRPRRCGPRAGDVWEGLPTYRRLFPVRLRDPRRAGRPHRPGAAGLRDARRRRRHDPGPLLHDELGVTNGLLVVDGLALRDFDYIDIGRVRHPRARCR